MDPNMNNSQYNGQMHQLHQQQLEQLCHDQHLTPQQLQELAIQHQNQLHQQQQPQIARPQNRRKIRKQKNADGTPLNAADGQPNEPTKKEKKAIDDNVSLEEALKALTMTAEGACSATKTPVSVLQELLSRRGITPTYDLVQIEGAIHEPTFRYRVTFGSKDGKYRNSQPFSPN